MWLLLKLLLRLAMATAVLVCIAMLMVETYRGHYQLATLYGVVACLNQRGE